MADKYCLITGAAGGFGRAYTRECIKLGYIPILTDINQEKLAEIQQDLAKEFSVDALIVMADIRNKVSAEAIWNFLENKGILLSLVINIVGIEIQGWFNELSSDEIIKIVETNILGFTNILTNCLKYKAENLDIINFGSLAGFFSMPYKAVYAASKSYIINLSRSLNLELKDKDVNVLVVCPAGVPTRQEVIERIKRQGIYGKLTASKTEEIVEKSLRFVAKGKAVYVPRFMNRLLLFISRILPDVLVSKLIYRRWRKREIPK